GALVLILCLERRLGLPQLLGVGDPGRSASQPGIAVSALGFNPFRRGRRQGRVQRHQRRALERAGIVTGLTRLVAAGVDDALLLSISDDLFLRTLEVAA